MSDTPQKYGTLLTAAGKMLIAQAAASKSPLSITHIAFGDGGGEEYFPLESQEALRNEVYQTEISSIDTDPENPNWIVVEAYLKENIGAWYIREAAIKTEDGTVIAVGSYPSTYKPKLEEGAATANLFKFILEVTNADSVTLKVDSSLIFATKEYVDSSIENHSSQTNVHGGTYEKTPNRLMLRNRDGRCQVENPVEDADATPKAWVQNLVESAAAAGIEPWDEKENYELPALVWGSDNLLYIAVLPSGPSYSAGPRDPTSSSGYWLALGAWLFQKGGTAANHTFISRTSGTWTVPDGVRRVKITLTGGGGSGAFSNTTLESSGGAAGGTAIGFLDVIPGQEIPFTVGAGGPTPIRGNAGNKGGDSFCLSLTAEGGPGGIFGNYSLAGFVAGGPAAGGAINLRGGCGMASGSSASTFVFSGNGGTSFWGPGGVGAVTATLNACDAEDMDGENPGSGGGGCGHSLNDGMQVAPAYAGKGADGAFLAEWYEMV